MKKKDFRPGDVRSDTYASLTGIKALVLAGGISSRMGTDKGDLVYYKQPQKYHMASMFINLGLETYISVRSDQKKSKEFRYITDQYKNIGPMAGILSAFEQYNTAWLVVACDYPLMAPKHIHQLISQRDRDKAATVFSNHPDGLLLPTLAIYEPSFYPLMKDSLGRKNYSLQDLLKQNPIKTVKTQDRALISIDTPAQYEVIKKKIHENTRRNT